MHQYTIQEQPPLWNSWSLSLSCELSYEFSWEFSCDFEVWVYRWVWVVGSVVGSVVSLGEQIDLSLSASVFLFLSGLLLNWSWVAEHWVDVIKSKNKKRTLFSLSFFHTKNMSALPWKANHHWTRQLNSQLKLIFHTHPSSIFLREVQGCLGKQFRSSLLRYLRFHRDLAQIHFACTEVHLLHFGSGVSGFQGWNQQMVTTYRWVPLNSNTDKSKSWSIRSLRSLRSHMWRSPMLICRFNLKFAKIKGFSLRIVCSD